MKTAIRKNNIKSFILSSIYVVFTLTLCFLMLEYSSESSFMHLLRMQMQYVLLNILTIGILWCILQMITQRIWLSCLLCSSICFIIAIINHYVIMYHGMPLSFTVLRNLGTAMAVISSYHFTIDYHVGVILLFFLISLESAILMRRYVPAYPSNNRIRLVCNAFLLLICASVLFFGYLSDDPVKPPNTIFWLWSEAYNTYGYAACTVESFTQTINVVNEPDGYSEHAVQSIEINNNAIDSAQNPDIILILNETFYDLAQISEPNANIPYMQNINSMDNLLKGYAVVPVAGGGTNASEYELLTSNSMQLMPGVTPFNALDLNGSNSIVSHLNTLGYYTIGSHAESPSNYMRGQAYPALGFHEIHFNEDFLDKEYLDGRIWHATDQSLYNNLIRWYENAPADAPRFLYLLTIQNHSPHDQRDSRYDIVCTGNDYLENTQLVNEYLSCIYHSDQAFQNLIEYYSAVNRPVIICMVGDHAPSFALSITDGKNHDESWELAIRKVPLLIWANYDLADVELGTMSMNYVVPTLLDLADVKLSSYYSYMLEAKKSVPIITAYGRYYDAAGNLSFYETDDGAPLEDIVDQYFYLEYHNLLGTRNQKLFAPYN